MACSSAPAPLNTWGDYVPGVGVCVGAVVIIVIIIIIMKFIWRLLYIVLQSCPWSPCPGAAKDPGRVGGSSTPTEAVMGVGGKMCVSSVCGV